MLQQIYILTFLIILSKSFVHLKIIVNVKVFFRNFDLFVRVKVAKVKELLVASTITGWLYFIAWSIGVWPQVYVNWRRKSVVGLSFDYLALGMYGHMCYALFNAILYWDPYVEDEYFLRNPHGLNPVIDNDVGYAVHSVGVTGLLILQCLIYDVKNDYLNYLKHIFTKYSLF